MKIFLGSILTLPEYFMLAVSFPNFTKLVFIIVFFITFQKKMQLCQCYWSSESIPDGLLLKAFAIWDSFGTIPK